MRVAVLDTDVLSALMRKNPVVLSKVRVYLIEHMQLTFSIITRYEILRGLKAKKAVKQESIFDRFCQKMLFFQLQMKLLLKQQKFMLIYVHVEN